MWVTQVVLSIALLGQTSDNKASLEPLQKRVKATRISLVTGIRQGAEGKPATLVETPVFRYSDELRDIENAGIWLWTSHNRPVAALKVERYKEGRFRIPWLYCFTSLSADLVRAEWEDAPSFQTRKAGVAWQTLADKPAPSRAARLIQMRELARQFSAELLKDAEGKERTQMRMLSRPLYRCEESSEVLDGAIFGFTGTGTNPDLLLLLDLPPEGAWRFGAAGMTAEGLRIKRKDSIVYESPHTAGKGNVFDNWCNFHPAK
jgi:hypothetical protein